MFVVRRFQRTVLRGMLDQIADVTTSQSPATSPFSASGYPMARARHADRIRSSPESPATTTSGSSPGSPSAPKPTLHIEWCEDGERGWELLSSGLFHLAISAHARPLDHQLHACVCGNCTDGCVLCRALRPSRVWSCARTAVDIHMPGVSGLDLSWCYQQLLMQAASANRQRTEPDEASSLLRQTVLIAFTADETATQPTLQQYGIADVIHKPIKMQTLRHMLHKWMCARETRERARTRTHSCAQLCTHARAT